jgi:hypothetical protein
VDVKTRSNFQFGKYGLDGTVYSGFGGAAVTAASAVAFKPICQKIGEPRIATVISIVMGLRMRPPRLGETNAR